MRRAPTGAVTRGPRLWLGALALAAAPAAACGGRGDARGATAAAAPNASPGGADAFRPLAVGDLAPRYAAARVGPGGAPGDSVRAGPGAGAPMLLNVWATWCTSCREEMADLEALHREFGPRGLRVVAVSVDQGNPARVARYAESQRLTFAVAHDPAGRVQDAFQVVGVPETYLLDAEGRVRWKGVGNVHGALPQARAAIAAVLLGGSPGRGD